MSLGKKYLSFSVILLLLFLHSNSYCQGRDAIDGPIRSRNQYPPFMLFMDLYPDGANTAPKGHVKCSFNMEYSNIYQIQAWDGWHAEADMEALRVSLDVVYGLWDDLDVGVEIPFVYLLGGFLDHTTEEVHDILSVSNHIRDLRRENDLSYFIRHDGRYWFSVDSPTSGLGDIVLHGKYRFLREGPKIPSSSIRLGVKFPTGDEERGMGSGEFDLGYGLVLEKHWGKWGFYLGLNHLLLGDPDGVFDIDIHNAFSGTFALEYWLWENFSLLGQINGHTSPYSTGIEALDDDDLQILFGVKYRFLKNAIWQISFTENIEGLTVSDFTIHTGIVFSL